MGVIRQCKAQEECAKCQFGGTKVENSELIERTIA